jgi:uncharacterized membrane protein
MTVPLLALLIGIVAGLRTLMAPAAISWAAYLGWVHLEGTWLAFLGYVWTPWILTLLALVELVADQLPSTPSRTLPAPFCARLVTGATSGAAIGAAGGMLVVGGVAGVIGAAIGAFGGRAARAKLATAFGRDAPAALIEDAVAVVAAIVIVRMIP